MTDKKKTLIELMLDAGVKPEDVDERTKYFVSDDPYEAGKSAVSQYSEKPIFSEALNDWYNDGYINPICITKSHPANWKRTIITKQQFIYAYNEKNKQVCKLDAVDLSAGFRERGMNKGVTNTQEDKQVEDVEPCMVVDNSDYDCESTDDTGISLSFEEVDKRADNYASLSNVLRRAYDQASSGKGQERHGQDLPFTKQPMQLIQDLCGEGFALGQAMKKMQESQRLPHDAAMRELLGAINYIAGAIIHKEKLQGSK